LDLSYLNVLITLKTGTFRRLAQGRDGLVHTSWAAIEIVATKWWHLGWAPAER
jgi:hypothetical protein